MHPGGAHGWVEFHTGEGWEIADPTATVKKGWDGRGVNMLVLDAMVALPLGFYERRRKRKGAPTEVREQIRSNS